MYIKVWKRAFEISLNVSAYLMSALGGYGWRLSKEPQPDMPCYMMYAFLFPRQQSGSFLL
jgi:hypothetical protein